MTNASATKRTASDPRLLVSVIAGAPCSSRAARCAQTERAGQNRTENRQWRGNQIMHRIVNSGLGRPLRALALLIALGGLGGAGWAGAAPVQAEGAAPAIQGSKPGVYGPVFLHAGLVVVRAKSNGAENFAAELINQDPANRTPVTRDPTASQDFYELFNAIGRFDGAATALLKQDDNYYLSVDLASGRFDVTFEQPSPDTVTTVNQTSFSGGRWQHVTPYFNLSAGPHTVSVSGDASALRAKLYYLDNLGGSVIVSDQTGYYEDELIDTTFPPFYTAVSVNAPADGVYLLYVNAGGDGTGNWTVTVQ